MDFKRYINTENGKIIISILLGLGVATLFRRNCTGRKCIVFKGPDLEDMEEKKYKYGDKCFHYVMKSKPCDEKKKYVDFA